MLGRAPAESRIMAEDGSYTPFDHTADIGVDVEAPTIEKLYETAATALFDLLVDRRSVTPRLQRTVTVTGGDAEELLVRWLAELLYLHDAEGLLFRHFAVIDASQGRLTATATGEVCDPGRHRIRTEVKAVTYHQVDVRRDGDRWTARIVFDV